MNKPDFEHILDPNLVVQRVYPPFDLVFSNSFDETCVVDFSRKEHATARMIEDTRSQNSLSSFSQINSDNLHNPSSQKIGAIRKPTWKDATLPQSKKQVMEETQIRGASTPKHHIVPNLTGIGANEDPDPDPDGVMGGAAVSFSTSNPNNDENRAKKVSKTTDDSHANGLSDLGQQNKIEECQNMSTWMKSSIINDLILDPVTDNRVGHHEVEAINGAMKVYKADPPTRPQSIETNLISKGDEGVNEQVTENPEVQTGNAQLGEVSRSSQHDEIKELGEVSQKATEDPLSISSQQHVREEKLQSLSPLPNDVSLTTHQESDLQEPFASMSVDEVLQFLEKSILEQRKRYEPLMFSHEETDDQPTDDIEFKTITLEENKSLSESHKLKLQFLVKMRQHYQQIKKKLVGGKNQKTADEGSYVSLQEDLSPVLLPNPPNTPVSNAEVNGTFQENESSEANKDVKQKEIADFNHARNSYRLTRLMSTSTEASQPSPSSVISIPLDESGIFKIPRTPNASMSMGHPGCRANGSGSHSFAANHIGAKTTNKESQATPSGHVKGNLDNEYHNDVVPKNQFIKSPTIRLDSPFPKSYDPEDKLVNDLKLIYKEVTRLPAPARIEQSFGFAKTTHEPYKQPEGPAPILHLDDPSKKTRDPLFKESHGLWKKSGTFPSTTTPGGATESQTSTVPTENPNGTSNPGPQGQNKNSGRTQTSCASTSKKVEPIVIQNCVSAEINTLTTSDLDDLEKKMRSSTTIDADLLQKFLDLRRIYNSQLHQLKTTQP